MGSILAAAMFVINVLSLIAVYAFFLNNGLQRILADTNQAFNVFIIVFAFWRSLFKLWQTSAGFNKLDSLLSEITQESVMNVKLKQKCMDWCLLDSQNALVRVSKASFEDSVRQRAGGQSSALEKVLSSSDDCALLLGSDSVKRL